MKVFPKLKSEEMDALSPCKPDMECFISPEADDEDIILLCYCWLFYANSLPLCFEDGSTGGEADKPLEEEAAEAWFPHTSYSHSFH